MKRRKLFLVARETPPHAISSANVATLVDMSGYRHPACAGFP
jgi:3-polyprenyl-4-hydroxybenzoate decarboxylase